MSRPKLAIIGTGIAGMGCAHLLYKRFDITLFEKNDYVGGHTCTVDLMEESRAVSFDSGFMVFNKVTYPYLCALFEELQVPVQPTDMSFSVQHVSSGLEFSGSSLNHLFAQRRNLFRLHYWRMLLQVNRFNTEAMEALAGTHWEGVSLGDYVRQRKYGQDFLEFYLTPMGSAVWSSSSESILDFPALTLLRFFHNHGFLGLKTQHPWWTVTHGAREYVDRLVRPFADRIRQACPAIAIRRELGGAVVTAKDGQSVFFEKVILAAHANESLSLLKDADSQEEQVLGKFHYRSNLITIHSDETLMPRTKKAWASWNYRMGEDSQGNPLPQTLYWMNRLQNLDCRQNYFVSVNGSSEINPETVHRRIEYTHPQFTVEAVRAQAQLPLLNRRSPNQAVYFAGSYFRYGFHEDAYGSAVDLAGVLLGKPIYPGLGWL